MPACRAIARQAISLKNGDQQKTFQLRDARLT
jgi:hypothetical protein